jgi:hypothetical protein
VSNSTYLLFVVDVFDLHAFRRQDEMLGDESMELGIVDALGDAEASDVVIKLYLERNVGSVRHQMRDAREQLRVLGVVYDSRVVVLLGAKGKRDDESRKASGGGWCYTSRHALSCCGRKFTAFTALFQRCISVKKEQPP